MKIAIQGQPASFHDIAARKFFDNDIELLSCNSFKSTFDALANRQADQAIVAIENSLYGSINEVYDLLLVNDVEICGEIYLRIEQCLIGFSGVNLEDIKEVHSHPVALAQCTAFLDENLPNAERFEHSDTAASVKDIKKWGNKHKAAIASSLAAELYEMPILSSGIETNKQNYTRFVVLRRKQGSSTKEKSNKTSIILQTPKDTKAGALYRALGVFAEHNVNLSALNSRPIVGKAWHYMFYADIELSTSNPLFDEMLVELERQGCHVTVLGSYRNGMN